ncbi:MAG TPA: PAC2 family protein [Mycobacteriales bacterium]|nr:PAC2 family protein [Mycobacteriales bacterium]
MALDPRELVELEAARPDLGQPVLIQALDGFVDAGGGRRLAREHLLEAGDPVVVARFDVDQLLDYRARRPPMVFIEDHWESYLAPELVIHALEDAAGTPYLLLSGPEPDYQWERFVAAVGLVVEALGVRLSVGLNAIPMGVPHTRPVGVIAHATRPEIVSDFESWVQAVQVPGAAGHLLEFRLGQSGVDAAGFAAHVPHYVAATDYPAAADALLQSVSRISGLVLPTDALATAAVETRRLIDDQVAQSEDVVSVVRALEAQYDEFVAGRGPRLVADGSALPTADEIGAELERFLAEHRGPTDV